MLLDKRKVGMVTKVGAIVISLAFIVTFIPYIRSVTDTTKTGSQTDQVGQKIVSLEQAVQKNPKNADAWAQLGNAYYDARAYDRAIPSYQKALELDPKKAGVRVDMAISYFGIGQLETATAQAQEAIKTDPNFSQAYYNLGVFLSAQGKNEEAILAYDSYIKLDPKGEGVSRAKEQISVLKKAKTIPTTAPAATPATGNNGK